MQRMLKIGGPSIVSYGSDVADGIAVFFNATAKILMTIEILPGRLLLIDCVFRNLE